MDVICLLTLWGTKREHRAYVNPSIAYVSVVGYPLNSRLQLIFIFYSKCIKSLTVAAVHWQFVWIFAVQWLMFLGLHIEKGTAESLAQWFCYYDRRCGSSLEYYSYILVKR